MKNSDFALFFFLYGKNMLSLAKTSDTIGNGEAQAKQRKKGCGSQ